MEEVIMSRMVSRRRKFTMRSMLQDKKSSLPPNLRLRLFTLFDLPRPYGDSLLPYAWNQEDCSDNILVLDLTMIRSSPVDSTDCIRGRTGFDSGLHAWEIMWHPERRGTHAVIGVATRECPLQGDGYQYLVGNNTASWGWDIVSNVLYHDGSGRIYPEETYRAPERIKVILDCDNRTLSFMANARFLGVAFENLPGQKLYPILSCVFGHANVSMRYINSLESGPTSLMDLSRRVIRFNIAGPDIRRKINVLHLPKVLKQYLLYRE